MVRVILPFHLRNLARVAGPEVQLEIDGSVTQRAIIDALEAGYPTLQGTIRDYATGKRRPLLRFYACEEDFSDAAPDDPVPEAVATGKEPYWIIGAVAGG